MGSPQASARRHRDADTGAISLGPCPSQSCNVAYSERASVRSRHLQDVTDLDAGIGGYRACRFPWRHSMDPTSIGAAPESRAMTELPAPLLVFVTSWFVTGPSDHGHQGGVRTRQGEPQKKEGRHFPLGSPPAPQIPPARVRVRAGSPL